MESWETYRKKINNDANILKQALDHGVDGILITAAKVEDNPIIYASKGFLKLTEYKEHEILGKNCRFLQGIDTPKETINIIKSCISSGQTFNGPILNYTKHGKCFTNHLRIVPIFDDKNEIEYFLGSQINLNKINFR